MAEQYEFNEEQNQAIGSLSHKLWFVSIFLIVIAILGIIDAIIPIFKGMASITQLGPDLVKVLVLLLIGVWGLNVARSFQLVVDTEGNDIDHLMNAVGNLNKLVGLAYWLLMIIIFVVLLAFILGMVLGAMSPPT
jgi:uncharacterized protein involved in cysteine biosynthesis